MRDPSPIGGVRRVAFVAHSGLSLARFRGPLMRAVAARRHAVLALAPEIAPATAAALQEAGITPQTFALAPEGAGPFAARRSESALAEALAQFAPHVVVASGPRTATLGARLGQGAGAKHVVLIVNGLSALGLEAHTRRGWLGQRSARREQKAAIESADLVVVHNGEDARRLIAEEVMPASKPQLVTPGSGVDLAHYAQAPLPLVADGLVFLMLGRLDETSGAGVFAQAAARIKAKGGKARFVLAGSPGQGSGALSARHAGLVASGVELPGFLADVRPAIAAAHVIVHPSPSEGLAGALLEALAMGRPVIASDIPGSRQVVDERVNGSLFAAGDDDALAASIETYLRRPDLIPAMARASRAKAERLFDERTVTATMMEALGLE